MDEVTELVDAPGPEVVLDDPYPPYNGANSRVLSGPLGTARHPGTRFKSWREAERHLLAGGKVYAFWTVPGRWFARVPKPAPSSTPPQANP